MLWIRSAISLVDCVDFSASLRTSSATTAKPETVFAGAGRFDGGVQCQQVGLFGKIVDDFDDFADVVGAMAENVDDFRGRLNGVIGAIQAVGSLSPWSRCR